MLKGLEKNMIQIIGKVEYKLKKKGNLEQKTAMFNMKFQMYGLNIRLDLEGEITSETEGIFFKSCLW